MPGQRYASKCPSGAKSFYLHLTYAMTSDVSYSRKPMGVPYHKNMLKKISKVVIKLDVYQLMKT